MGFRILVVDDSPIIRTMLRRTIEICDMHDCEVFDASNGLEALAILDQQWIDLMCLDLNMPEMNGIELVKRMSSDDVLSSIPMIVISSERSQTRIDHLKQMGICAFLKKPFRPEEFKRVVQSIVEK